MHRFWKCEGWNILEFVGSSWMPKANQTEDVQGEKLKTLQMINGTPCEGELNGLRHCYKQWQRISGLLCALQLKIALNLGKPYKNMFWTMAHLMLIHSQLIGRVIIYCMHPVYAVWFWGSFGLSTITATILRAHSGHFCFLTFKMCVWGLRLFLVWSFNPQK